MTALLAAFLTGAALLWLSVFGYLLVLLVLAGRRHWRRRPVGELPSIAVLMATLNEIAGIDAKLADLARIDYPADRLRFVIVDGGSTDGTVARIEAARAAGAPIELLRAPHLGYQARAVALRPGERRRRDWWSPPTPTPRLDPGCIRALVELLVSDPTTAVVGARVRPGTELLEERIYWWFLNTLWWLEGEALSAAMVSGVCYALRRSIVVGTPRAAGADDVLFALAAGAHGHGVRLCRARRRGRDPRAAQPGRVHQLPPPARRRLPGRARRAAAGQRSQRLAAGARRASVPLHRLAAGHDRGDRDRPGAVRDRLLAVAADRRGGVRAADGGGPVRLAQPGRARRRRGRSSAPRPCAWSAWSGCRC